ELVEVAAHRLALGLREVARIGELPALVQFDLLDEAPANRRVFYDQDPGELERVSRLNRPRPNDDLGVPLIRPMAPHEAAAAGGALRLLPGTEGPMLDLRLDDAARDVGVLREVQAWPVQRAGVGEPLVERLEREPRPVVDDLRLAVLVDDLRAFERTERLVANGRLVHGATGRILDDPGGDPVVAELLPQRDAMVAIQDLVGTIGPPAHHRGRRVRGGGPELLFDRVGLHVPG